MPCSLVLRTKEILSSPFLSKLRELAQKIEIFSSGHGCNLTTLIVACQRDGALVPLPLMPRWRPRRWKCTTRDCRHFGALPSAWDNRRGTRNGSRTRTSVSRRRVPIVPTRIKRGEVLATVAVAPSVLGDVATVAVAFLARTVQRAIFGDHFSAGATGCAAAILSVRKRWQSRIRVQPMPWSKTA